MSSTQVLPTPRPPPFSGKAAGVVLLITVIYGFYAAIMIYNSSVLYLGQRWYCLLDDAMISMRYARNLAGGLGLVWNAGERVEGLTNPGWALIMALVHLIEPNRAYTSLYIQIVSALSIAATISVVARLAWQLSRGSLSVTACTAAATGFYYPLNYFSLFGMETGILALFITSAAASFVYNSANLKFPLASYVFLGIATLIRIDMAVPLLVIGVYGMLTSSAPNRFRHLAALVIVLLVFVGGQTLARMVYYGYPVPNTYYLKMTGFPVLLRIARGVMVTGTSLGYLLWPTILAGLCYVLYFRGKGLSLARQRLRKLLQPQNTHPIVLLLLLFAGQAAYSAYVGGDAWEWLVFCNRYMVVAVPLLMIPYFMLLIKAIKTLGLARFLLRNPYAELSIILLAVLLSVFLVNSQSFNKQHRGEVYLANKPLLYNDNRVAVLSSVMLRGAAGDRIASDCAGAIPYFIDGYAVDPLGKCDGYISRLTVKREYWIYSEWYNAYYPGHMKWDPAYTWEKYKPEYMVLRWPVVTSAFGAILKAHYICIPDEDGNRFVWKRV